MVVLESLLAISSGAERFGAYQRAAPNKAGISGSIKLRRSPHWNLSRTSNFSARFCASAAKAWPSSDSRSSFDITSTLDKRSRKPNRRSISTAASARVGRPTNVKTRLMMSARAAHPPAQLANQMTLSTGRYIVLGSPMATTASNNPRERVHGK